MGVRNILERFFPGKPFGLVVGKTMSLAMSGAHTLHANITIGRRGLPGTNNLAI